MKALHLHLKLYRHYVVLISVLIFSLPTISQVSTIPAFPIVDDSVTVIFDATQGNAALATFTGTVYAHTGLITNLSTSPTDWKYVQGVWGTADPEVEMTSLGNHLYKLRYHIRNYYGLPASEIALKMAFVFRNATGTIVGRASDGSDIYVDLFQPGLNVSIVQPVDYGILVEPAAAVNLQAVSSMADSLAFYINGNLMTKTNNDSLSFSWTPPSSGKFWVKAKAWNAAAAAWDSTYIFVRPAVNVAALPAGIQDGINYSGTNSVVLSLYAPEKNFAFAVGDYSNWEMDQSNYMNRTPDGQRYWVQIDNLNPGQEYSFQYFIDNNLKVADPYSEKILDPWNDSYIPENTYPGLMSYPTGKTTGIVSVLQTNQSAYNWQITNFVPYDKTNMIVYELLLRDFTSSKNFQSLIDTLNYLKTLGVNCIELMPVNEFEGNLSWGYNPDFFFAPDKFYGTAAKMKEFIDIAHENGMAVIMDIALNHAFGQCPLAQLYWDATNNRPAANNPWFNPIAKHDFNVGNDFNHENAATKLFASRVIKHWITEYKIDGYRFDLSKGFTQNNTLGNTAAWGAYDASRVAILKAYADTIWNVNPNAIVVLEHFADNSEEKVLAEYGMLLWGKMNYNYNEATMGWVSNSDLSWGLHTSRGWSVPHVVAFMESHDEERLMAKNIAYGNNTSSSHDTRNLDVALRRMETAACFFLPLPGPKMIWQFGELGYDFWINYPGTIGGSDHRLDEKPIRWDYYAAQNRNRVYNVYRWLNWLKKNEPVFSAGTFSYVLTGGTKRINIQHSSANVCILGNFNVTAADISPVFATTGKWYEFFSGDSITVNDVNANINLQPGEYRVYITKKFPKPELFTPPYSFNNHNHSSELLVFPNPSSSDFMFVLPEYQSTSVTINIFDLGGKQIYSQSLRPQEGILTVPTNFLPGIYFYSLKTASQIYSGKLVKQ
jgi:glycosidase